MPDVVLCILLFAVGCWLGYVLYIVFVRRSMSPMIYHCYRCKKNVTALVFRNTPICPYCLRRLR